MADAPERLFTPFGDLNAAISRVLSGEKKKKEHSRRWKHLTSLHEFCDWVADWGVSRIVVLIPFFLALVGICTLSVPNFPALAASWIILASPIWVPIVAINGAWKMWVWYVRALYIAKLKTVVLDVKIPREIYKSPRAMETALTQFWINANETTFIDRFWEGKMRPVFSLEIASFGGDVHFYIWCWKMFQNVVETAIYSQYPEVEIQEAEDYASKFVLDSEQYDMFANEMILMNEPTGILPIRTYVDYELDKDPKEEFKVDPMAQVVELLGSGRKSEQMWIQIIIHPMKYGGVDKFTKDAEKRVEQIRAEASLRPKDPASPTAEEEPKLGFPQPTWRQTEQIRAIERHMAKRLFMVGIRVCYIAKYEDYRADVRNGVRWMLVPYASQWLNWMRPKRWHGPFDYPWQDFKGIRWRHTSRRFLDAYRRRSYFYAPWVSPHFVMSVEALASLWHPPSSTITPPGLQRIPATKAKPPPNLPK